MESIALRRGRVVDHHSVDLAPSDVLPIHLRLGSDQVVLPLKHLGYERLVVRTESIVPPGVFVAIRIELGVIGEHALDLIGVVEASRPFLSIRFEGLDVTAKERLVAVVRRLALHFAPEDLEPTRVDGAIPTRPAPRPGAGEPAITSAAWLALQAENRELRALLSRETFERQEAERRLRELSAHTAEIVALFQREMTSLLDRVRSETSEVFTSGVVAAALRDDD
jgi:hypothetical protein